jgi:hypothetical protein
MSVTSENKVTLLTSWRAFIHIPIECQCTKVDYCVNNTVIHSVVTQFQQ